MRSIHQHKRHPEVAAQRPSKDGALSPFEARLRAHLRVTDRVEMA